MTCVHLHQFVNGAQSGTVKFPDVNDNFVTNCDVVRTIVTSHLRFP